MPRHAFLMQLKPGAIEDYRRRHDAIWPELKRELRAAGISDYSIYLNPATGQLFACQLLARDATPDALPTLPIMQRWWESMAPLMETHPDHSPVCTPLTEVFHMD